MEIVHVTKLCINCKHHRGDKKNQCAAEADKILDVVTGAYKEENLVSCYERRQPNGLCGRDAFLYVEK